MKAFTLDELICHHGLKNQAFLGRRSLPIMNRRQSGLKLREILNFVSSLVAPASLW